MSHYLYETDTKPTLSRPYESILAAPVRALEEHRETLVCKWTELYLMTFGRKAFFSSERVSNLFSEMADVFIESLRDSNLEFYFETLRSKGRFFSTLEVPFEEVVLCLQLFEEAYLSIFLGGPSGAQIDVKEVLLAFEEFNNVSTAVFAVSYFRGAKHKWKTMTRNYQEENEKLMQDLQSLHEELFTSTKNQLASMELMLSGINRKLRKNVAQSRKIQRFTEMLEREPNQKSLLKIADRFMKQSLPAASEMIFGIFDESQRKLMMYSWFGREPSVHSQIPSFGEIFFSELPTEYQEALFSDEKKAVTVKDSNLLPRFFAEDGRFSGFEDFLFLPLQKYRDALGFVWIASREKNIFSRQGIKYNQRLCRVLANAIFSVVYFNRHKKHSDFITMLDRLEDRVLQRQTLESTLDYSLESMIRLLDVERASLMLLDKKKLLSIYAAKGYRVYPFSGTTLKWGEGIAGWSVKEGKIVSIPRMKKFERRFLPNVFHRKPRTSGAQMNVRSLLCVPLMQRKEPVGVLNLSTISYHKNFEPSEIDMVHQFTQRLASAMTSLATMNDLETYVHQNQSG